MPEVERRGMLYDQHRIYWTHAERTDAANFFQKVISNETADLAQLFPGFQAYLQCRWRESRIRQGDTYSSGPLYFPTLR